MMIIFRMYINVHYFKQSSNFRYYFLEQLETPRSVHRQKCVCRNESQNESNNSINGLLFATETRNTDREDKTKFLKGQILGAFAKLQNADVSFVKFARPSVRPSVRPPARPTARNNSSSIGRIFMEFHI